MWLYGIGYGTVHVGSNGFVTFSEGSSQYCTSLDTHFSTPRISCLNVDLLAMNIPGGGVSGVVYRRQLGDRLVVTWDGMLESGRPFTHPNSFQLEMLFNGTIRITDLAIGAPDGIAGLSMGIGVPPRHGGPGRDVHVES